MASERLDPRLPDLNLNPTDVKELRPLGTFDDELKSMLARMEKAKPFPESEVTIEAMGVTRAMCPFDTETWSVNMGYWQVFQLDGQFSKIFLTHTQIRDVHGKEAFCWDDFNKMADAGIDVYNTHKVKGLNSKLYPYKRISKKFNTEYFSNTLAYMIALALDMGYKKINLYGSDMMTRSEYAWEKGGMEYWLGRAHGMGVETKIAEGSSLLSTITGKPYGMKYYKMSDIDPRGTLRRKVKQFTPVSTATGFMFENPIQPAMPVPTPWVQI